MRSLLPSLSHLGFCLGILASAALAAGCGDGPASSSNGGTGGGTSSGGSGGTTTTASLEACPLNADAHVAATVIGPDGMPLTNAPGGAAGTIAALGIDSPPSAQCGSGEAWVQITSDAGDGVWLGCFQAPNLVLDATVGQPAELQYTLNASNPAPPSTHTTLKVNDALVVQIEQASWEADVALPGGMTIGRAEKVCDSLSDPCQIEGYDPAIQSGDEVLQIPAGESGDVGGYRVYVDRYWTAKPSSGCDGGDADIRLSIAPSPGI